MDTQLIHMFLTHRVFSLFVTLALRRIECGLGTATLVLHITHMVTALSSVAETCIDELRVG